MPKCASTWLQNAYFQKRHGFEMASEVAPAHTALIAPISFRFSDWSEGRQFFNFETGDRVPVISAEVLVGNPLTGGDNGETMLHRLRQLVPEARILLIIREQQAMIRSIYKTLVTFGSPLSIEDHLYNDLPGNMPSFSAQYLFYDDIIAAYQAVFGADSVLVLTLEQFQAEPQEFLTALNGFCGVDSERYPLKANPKNRVNPNFSLVSLELKRLYNRFVAKTRMSPAGLIKPRLIGERGVVHPPVPAFVENWMERRFAAKIAYLTDGFYAQSNARTEGLTGLQLRELGYQLPDAGPAQ